jgi:phosphoribosylanthranilate isomerase
VIGVFQNDRLETVRELYQALELDAVQLHGSESPEDCLALGLPFIKMLPLIRQLEAQTVLSYCQPPLLGLCRGLILERPKTDPWPEPAALPVFFPVPVLIAGGLTPDTVATVVQTYRPSGVDVSSGVESAPGVKDPELLRAFYTAARQAHPDFLTQLEATRPCNP